MVLTKKFNAIVLGILVILMGILAVGTIDYTISVNLVNPDSIWAEFFNLFGEMPANVGILLSVTLLYGSRKDRKGILSILVHILSPLLILLFSLMTVVVPIGYVFEHTESGMPQSALVVGLFIGLVLAIGLIVFALKVNKEKIRKFRMAAWSMILLVLGEIILVNVLKILWARPRMRSIDSIEGFNYWYQIQGPTGDNELKSFPSGHTANGFATIGYSMFLFSLNKAWVKPAIYFGLTWGTLTALSRVVLGAHFLSDVLVGGYITILLFLLISRRVFKKAA